LEKFIEQENSFIQFLTDYKRLIIKVAGIYVQHSEERKDLVQEIILQLWKAWPRYNPEFALSTWAYRIALNVSISYLRKDKSRKLKHETYESQWDILQWDNENLNKQLEQLYFLLEYLRPIDKALIILSLEGKKNKEIAKVMGMTATNVSTKLQRIKEQLKKQYQQSKD